MSTPDRPEDEPREEDVTDAGTPADDPVEEVPAPEEGATEIAEEGQGAEAPAPAEAAPPETPDPPAGEAEGTAAAETGVDKRAAGAVSSTGQRSGRRPRADRSGVIVRAQAKYVRTSARKARLVCDNIRGKDVEQARAILAFTPRAAAEAWSKLLESAVANAENNHELVGDELRILSVQADEGPTLKRFRPRAMGRATKIRKRTSHLTITLTPKD